MSNDLSDYILQLGSAIARERLVPGDTVAFVRPELENESGPVVLVGVVNFVDGKPVIDRHAGGNRAPAHYSFGLPDTGIRFLGETIPKLLSTYDPDVIYEELWRVVLAAAKRAGMPEARWAVSTAPYATIAHLTRSTRPRATEDLLMQGEHGYLISANADPTYRPVPEPQYLTRGQIFQGLLVRCGY
jgi:hypothetical protein